MDQSGREAHGSPISAQHADACLCMVNSVVIVACMCPSGAKARWFRGQVLVPLTSLNEHIKADVRSLWAAPLFMCEKPETLVTHGLHQFDIFCLTDRDGVESSSCSRVLIRRV